MKYLVTLLFTVLLTLNAEATNISIWKGSCKNVTYGIDGLLTLCTIEEEGKVTGYVSISGWLVGSGEITGTRSGLSLRFSSKDPVHGVDIDWDGQLDGLKLAGEYHVTKSLVSGTKEVGEFSLELVNVYHENAADRSNAFKYLFAVLIESQLNEPVTLSDGTKVPGADALFRSIHPAGTGVSVNVTKVEMEWKEGSKKDQIEDIRRYAIEYTLYWHGVVQKQGWTKLRMTYNANLGSVTGNSIIETTGMTNSETDELLFNIGYIFGQAAMEALLNSK